MYRPMYICGYIYSEEAQTIWQPELDIKLFLYQHISNIKIGAGITGYLKELILQWVVFIWLNDIEVK